MKFLVSVAMVLMSVAALAADQWFVVSSNFGIAYKVENSSIHRDGSVVSYHQVVTSDKPRPTAGFIADSIDAQMQVNCDTKQFKWSSETFLLGTKKVGDDSASPDARTTWRDTGNPFALQIFTYVCKH